MSQIVTIECSNCEGVERYELEGCILLGFVGDNLFVKRHDITWGGVLDFFMAQFVEKEKNEQT